MMLKYFFFTLAVGLISFFILNDPKSFLKAFFLTVGIEKIILFEFFGFGGSREFLTKAVMGENERLFTREELSYFDGLQDESLPIYLSFLGNVFDVTEGAKHYAPGSSYHPYTGKDATRAFLTGGFTQEDLTDDLSEFSVSQMKEIKSWLDFYRKKYIYKGKLIGRFYDEAGRPTDYLRAVLEMFVIAEKEEMSNKALKMKYPPCNVEWTAEKGSRVWCSKKSGGVQRGWVGMPRKLYLPGESSYRCACIKDLPSPTEPSSSLKRRGNLEEYENCHPSSTSCYVQNDD